MVFGLSSTSHTPIRPSEMTWQKDASIIPCGANESTIFSRLVLSVFGINSAAPGRGNSNCLKAHDDEQRRLPVFHELASLKRLNSRPPGDEPRMSLHCRRSQSADRTNRTPSPSAATRPASPPEELREKLTTKEGTSKTSSASNPCVSIQPVRRDSLCSLDSVLDRR